LGQEEREDRRNLEHSSNISLKKIGEEIKKIDVTHNIHEILGEEEKEN
jgi:hypothetical protein